MKRPSPLSIHNHNRQRHLPYTSILAFLSPTRTMDAGAEGRRDVGSSDRSLDDDGNGDRPLVPRREGAPQKDDASLRRAGGACGPSSRSPSHALARRFARMINREIGHAEQARQGTHSSLPPLLLPLASLSHGSSTAPDFIIC